MAQEQDFIEKAAELIVRAKRVVVFTGAGVSTESGIPDFRSPGGIWTKYDPDDFTYEKFLADPEARKRNWRLFMEGTFINARPNPAHHAIAELERLGKVDCVITQNIDNLHQEAGSSLVIELHGTAKWVKCLNCGRRLPREDVERRLKEGEEEPHCELCGGLLKSATISFGEAMPVAEVMEAERHCRECDLCLVVGSSLVVYPAALMPLYALESGAKLIIVNLAPTHLDRYAEVCLPAQAGEVMPRILASVKEKIAGR